MVEAALGAFLDSARGGVPDLPPVPAVPAPDVSPGVAAGGVAPPAAVREGPVEAGFESERVAAYRRLGS